MPADPAATQTFLQSIPNTVWSGLLASLATFISTIAAVIVTNASNTKRMRVQLDHDADEKQKERVSALRRDLYLKAAETTVRANMYFGGMAQVDVTKPAYDAPLRDVLAVAAQMQLVVTQGTAQLISDLVSYYAELHMRLITKVGPINLLKSNIETVNALYENSQAEVKRVIAAMIQFNETGQRDSEAFQRLNRSAEIARKTSQGFAEERTKLWGQVNVHTLQFLRDLMPATKEIAKLQMHLIVELRRELTVGGDVEVFALILQRQLERMERAVDEFIRTINPAPNPTDSGDNPPPGGGGESK